MLSFVFPPNDAVLNGGAEANIVLPPFGSVIVAFTRENLTPAGKSEERRLADITCGWKIAGEDKIAKRADFFSAGKENFSGEVTFVKETDIAPQETHGRTILKLEDVADYASVSVNGEFAGARLWAPYTFDLTGKLHAGKNEIAVTIGSTEENAMTGSNKNAGVFGSIGIFEVK